MPRAKNRYPARVFARVARNEEDALAVIAMIDQSSTSEVVRRILERELPRERRNAQKRLARRGCAC